MKRSPRSVPQPTVERRGGGAALLLLPVFGAAGAWAAHLWLTHAPRAISPDLAQPLAVVTAWGEFGGVAFAILAATVAAATLALAFAARARRMETGAVVGIAAAALAANLAWPAVFSSDVYAYAAYGDLAARGIDPYLLAPPGLHDAFLDTARFQWSGPFPVCVYGPAFVAVARAVVTLAAPLGTAAVLMALRLVACAAFLGSIALLGAGLRDATAERRTFALYAYGLNPVALWSVAEGHNDALLLFAAAAAFVLARRAGALPGIFALALGPLVKAPGIMLAAVYALRVTWFDGEPPRRAWLAFGAGTVVAILAAVPPLLPALTRLGAHGVYAPSVSVQGLIGPLPAACLAAFALGNAARLLYGRSAQGFAWFGLALVVALPNTYPWYGLWLLPLTLAAGPGRAAAALWGVTIFALVRYLPDATGNMSWGALLAASAVAALPLALALTDRPTAFRKTTTRP